MNRAKIQSEIDGITHALEWIKEHRPEHYPQKFLSLVPLRCELQQMLDASEEKPAIAAYGESQKGKSYLMGNLLQKNGAPFMVRCGGEEYDFVGRINPIGDKREATGVVTRFSSFLNSGEDEANSIYPARMKVMSVAQVATILVDGYFNDLLDDKRFSDAEIQKRADGLYAKYKDKSSVQDILTEDDIIGIKLYLKKFVGESKIIAFCDNTDYFDKIALIVRNVPQNEWIDLFSTLWYDNKDITGLFSRLLRCLQRLNFVKEIYLPIDALLHKGNNKNTIMSVDCLNGLYAGEPQFSDVYVKSASGFRQMSGFDKSELSALCREVAFKVDVDYLDDRAAFYYDEKHATDPGYMSSEVFKRLTTKSQFVSKKDLLSVSDLLDFPGAKNREQMKEDTLDRSDSETQQSNLVKLFLRGKVSFLFNWFSDAKLLNILMFCHNAEDVKVTTMYNVIDRWIKTYVGDSPAERRKTVEKAGGVAPFFAIGTMFNIDMMHKNNEEANSPESLKGRWSGRFSKVMYQDCFHAGTDVQWFKNWTGEGESFKNIYVLRDFKYSVCDGQGNNLFRGYVETEANPQEKELALPPDFYRVLTHSFVSDEANVQRFFTDPRVAWEVASTLNNDGSLYIIQQLGTAAKNMSVVREAQFEGRSEEIRKKVLSQISNYFIQGGDTEKLKKNVLLARQMLWQLTVSSGNENGFFGRMIDVMQLTDDEVYAQVHKILTSDILTREVNEFKSNELITQMLPPCSNETEVLDNVMAVFGCMSREDALEMLQSKGLSPSDLINSDKAKRKNSDVIAEYLFNYWEMRITSPVFLNRIVSGSSFESAVMADFITNLLEMADEVKLTEVMSQAIADTVNILNVGTANEFLVTDALRHCINSFVTDLGISLCPAELVARYQQIAHQQNIPVHGYLGREEKEDYSEQDLTDMFNKTMAQQGAISVSFLQHYNEWLECMFLSFIATAGKVAKIDNPEANNRMGEIVKSFNETV